MSSYTATVTTSASTHQLLAVLTDPEAIRSWSPVPFELEGEAHGSLRAGTDARVNGNLGGLRIGFDVHVHEAGRDGLRLSADGPLSMDVAYGLRAMPEGSEVSARVSVDRSRGITARIVGKAAEAMLAAGALDGAAGRIARAAERAEPIAVAA
jgi:hypothetical protein